MSIKKVLESVADDDSGRLPVIFNGNHGPRCIGYAHSLTRADELGREQRLSAEYCSRADIDGRKFFLLHG